MAVGFVGRFFSGAGRALARSLNGSCADIDLAFGFASQFPMTIRPHFRRIQSRTDVNSAVRFASRCSDHFRAVPHSMKRRAYLACQFGSWVRSVVFGMVVSAKTISRKAAKIITQRIRRSGTRTRLISPSWNIAMNETLCFNIRHPATASPDSTGTRLAVGQAFQPDTSGCQAGKPDLLQTPLSSHVPGHCFFAYFLLCGFARESPVFVGIHLKL